MTDGGNSYVILLIRRRILPDLTIYKMTLPGRGRRLRAVPNS